MSLSPPSTRTVPGQGTAPIWGQDLWCALSIWIPVIKNKTKKKPTKKNDNDNLVDLLAPRGRCYRTRARRESDHDSWTTFACYILFRITRSSGQCPTLQRGLLDLDKSC